MTTVWMTDPSHWPLVIWWLPIRIHCPLNGRACLRNLAFDLIFFTTTHAINVTPCACAAEEAGKCSVASWNFLDERLSRQLQILLLYTLLDMKKSGSQLHLHEGQAKQSAPTSRHSLNWQCTSSLKVINKTEHTEGGHNAEAHSAVLQLSLAGLWSTNWHGALLVYSCWGFACNNVCVWFVFFSGCWISGPRRMLTVTANLMCD